MKMQIDTSERREEKAAKKEISALLLILHDLVNNNKRHSLCAAPGQMSMTQSAEDARRKKQRQLFSCCFSCCEISPLLTFNCQKSKSRLSRSSELINLNRFKAVKKLQKITDELWWHLCPQCRAVFTHVNHECNQYWEKKPDNLVSSIFITGSCHETLNLIFHLFLSLAHTVYAMRLNTL